MKKHSLVLPLAATICAFGVPAAQVALSAAEKSVPAATVPAQKSVSMLVLVRDASGKDIFKNCREQIASIVFSRLAGTGVAFQTLDFLKKVKTDEASSAADDSRDRELSALSPAEAIDISGADYALVLQIPAAMERKTDSSIYARQEIYYTLYAADGAVADSGKISKLVSAPIFDAASREQLALDTAEELAETLSAKISNKKILLKKASVAISADVAIACIVEEMVFPQIVENKDGTFSIGSDNARVTIPGVSLKIGGISYTLNPSGEATMLKLPLGRPLFIEVSHRDIEPLRQTIRVGKSGEKVSLALSLNEKARERWKRDSAEVSAIVSRVGRERSLSAAEAELIRGKAKFWENSGMKITQATSRKIVREEKSEFSDEVIPAAAQEN